MTGNRELFDKAMNQGHSAAWEQKWDQAAAYYRQALEEISNEPSALTSLGLALFEMKEFAEALKVYQQAARAQPDDPLPFEKTGAILERQNNPNEAVKAFMRAADLYLKNRNVEKSIDNWIKAINLKPENLVARSRLAVIYERMGRRIEAVSEYVALASLMQHINEIPKAVQTVEHALKIMPENVEAQQALVMLRSNQRLPRPGKSKKPSGSLKTAETHHQLEAPKQTTRAMDPIEEGRQNALIRLAAMLFEETDTPTSGQEERRGISALTRGTGRLPSRQADRTRILLHLSQAIDSQTQGDDRQASEEIERAIDIGLDHPAAHFNLGFLVAEKNRQKALQHLQVSVKHPKYALPSYLLLARIYQAENDYSQAANNYLQALRLADAESLPAAQADELRQFYEPILEKLANEKDEDALKKLCRNIGSQLLRPDWRQFLQIARQQLPPTPEGSPPIPLAEMLIETGNSSVIEATGRVKELANRKLYQTAIDEAFSAILEAPTYLPLHVQIADLLVQKGRTEEAVTKFLLVSELYSLRGETSQAIRLLERVAVMMPMNLDLRNTLIDLLVSQGQIDEAIEHSIELAGIYYQLTELDMARQTYTSALRLTQKSPTDRSWSLQILYKIADIDMQRLDWRQAIRIYEQIRTLEPEDTNSRSQLVSLNFRLNQDHAAMAEVDGFVSLLENSGKRKKAIEFLELVLQDQPDKLDIRKHLADLCSRDQNIPRAVEHLEYIVETFLKTGYTKNATGVLRAIIALNPPNVDEYRRALLELRNKLGKAAGAGETKS